MTGLLFSFVQDGSSGDPLVASSLSAASVAAVPSSSPSEFAVPSQLAEPAASQSLSQAPATPASETTGTASADGGLVLTLSTHRPCWVRMALDEGAPVERLLPPDTTITLKADQQAILRIGDATAVTMQINQQQTRPLGRDGRAVDLVVTPSNFRDYLSDGD